MANKYSNTKKFKILTEKEISEIYSIPKFTKEQKAFYFFIEEKLLRKIKNYSIESRIQFILDFGYFNAKRMFFTYSFLDILDDVKYIQKIYFPEEDINNILSKKSREAAKTEFKKVIQRKKITQEEMDRLGRISPYAWEHIDLYGKYDFNNKEVKKLERKLK